MMEMYQQGIVILTIIQQLQQTPTSFSFILIQLHNTSITIIENNSKRQQQHNNTTAGDCSSKNNSNTTPSSLLATNLN